MTSEEKTDMGTSAKHHWRPNRWEDLPESILPVAKVIPSDINTVKGMLSYLFWKIEQWTTEAEDEITEMIESNTSIDGLVINKDDVYPYAHTRAEKELYEFQETYSVPMSLTHIKNGNPLENGRFPSLIEMAFELTVNQMELIGGTGDIPMDVFETIEIAISIPNGWVRDRVSLFQSPEWWVD